MLPALLFYERMAGVVRHVDAPAGVMSGMTATLLMAFDPSRASGAVYLTSLVCSIVGATVAAVLADLAKRYIASRTAFQYADLSEQVSELRLEVAGLKRKERSGADPTGV